ncbi:MAG: phosphotransferase [Clostridiales bacterium]|nr:phosphotransferase [Clostridiales bacterium]
MNDNYLSVLQKYDGEAIEVRRGRGAWICTYPEGFQLLKEYRGSVQRLEFEETILSELRCRGISMVDCCVRNQEGSLLTAADDGTRFILKEWYQEKECSLGDSREVMLAVSWIARLHRAFREIGWREEWSLESMNPPEPGEDMRRHNRELKRVRAYIRDKRKKSEFELCVIRNFAAFYEQAVQAQAEWEQLEKKQGQDALFLCHGDLDQHHILLKESEACFIDFNQMHRGRQVTDLYHFMRKALEKHNWNERLGLSMIERYDRERTLSAADRRMLYYLFLYPEKYWKQLNYYYNASKSWLPARSVEKLKRLEAQQENRNRFLARIR